MLISTILLVILYYYYFYYCSYICLTFFLYVYGPCVCNKDILLDILLLDMHHHITYMYINFQ